MSREKQIVNERKRKIAELRKSGVEVYAHSFGRKQNVAKCLKLKIGEKVKVAGRVMTKRDLGKIGFAHLQDESGRIQIVLQEGETSKKDFFKRFVDSGDFVGVKGKMIKTKTKEISILVKKVELLSKAILPLPEKWHGLKDKEDRYRDIWI